MRVLAFGLTGGRNRTSIILPRSTTAGSIRLLGPCGEATEAWYPVVCIAQDDPSKNHVCRNKRASVKLKRDDSLQCLAAQRRERRCQPCE